VAVGVTLLADTQGWAGDALVWSSLAIFVGLAVLVDMMLRREGQGNGEEMDAAGAGGAP
jgi:hypothetical protein